MQIIRNNPYRTIGLLVGATVKEQVKQISKLKMLIVAEEEPQDDFSFPTIGKLHRTLDSVTDAASKLNHHSSRMNAALFWFYKGNAITDEPAFDAIKDGDLEQVLKIWSKLTATADVTQRNASAYNNLSTLYLSGILEGRNSNEAILEQGISLKLKFLESDFIKDFKALATDERFETTKKDLQLNFLNQVQSEVDKNGGVTSQKFLEILNKQIFSAKEDFLNGFVQKPIEQIEKKIEEIKKKLKANPEKAGEYGIDLYKTTKTSLASIISILNKSDIKIISISDKLANEILQCSIILFNHFHETDNEVGEIALDLNKKAKSIALGSVLIERINESTPIVEKYIKDKPERTKNKLIESDLKALVEILDTFKNRTDTIDNAKSLVNQSKPRLNSIRSVLGNSDNLYLKLSTMVAVMAQRNVIEEVNNAQENLGRTRAIDREVIILRFKLTLQNAWRVTDLIGRIDMEYDFKSNQYNPNKTALINLCNNFRVDTTPLETLLGRQLSLANSEMAIIKGWQFLRNESEKQSQINAQQRKIDSLNQEIRNL